MRAKHQLYAEARNTLESRLSMADNLETVGVMLALLMCVSPRPLRPRRMLPVMALRVGWWPVVFAADVALVITRCPRVVWRTGSCGW